MSEKRNSSLFGKITVVVVICCWVMGGLCVNTALALDGSGTQEEPWRITSLADFDEFVAESNYWDDYARLETDVNLAGLTYSTAVIAPDTDNSNSGFQGTPFTGVFDGNDHKIINLTINGGANDCLGLFGYINGGEVENLGLEDVSISGNDSVGGLAGWNDGSVSNCYSTGFVRGDYDVGGLLGANRGSVSNCYSTADVTGDMDSRNVGGLEGVNGGLVSNCYSTGFVRGDIDVGGLLGDCREDSNVSNCYSIGAVSGFLHVGGLVGINCGTVSDCYSTAVVIGHRSVGGLEGVNDGLVSNCYSTGFVSGDIDVGGLVGYNGYSPFGFCGPGYIYNSYSTGDVSGFEDVGGLVGRNNMGNVSDCYCIGDVNGVSPVGGLMGYNTDIISNCFWNTDTQNHGVTESIGLNEGTATNVEDLPTAQMQTKSTFTSAGWDFVEIWNISENQTYPYLRAYLPSDINKDRIVNFLDIAITANQWMQEQ